MSDLNKVVPMSMPPTVNEKELVDQIAELRNEVKRITKRNAILRQNLHEIRSFLVNQTSFVHNRIDAINAALDGEEAK